MRTVNGRETNYMAFNIVITILLLLLLLLLLCL